MHVFGAFELDIQPGTPDNPASVRIALLRYTRGEDGRLYMTPECWHRQLNELKAKRLTGTAVQKPTATPVTSAQVMKARVRASRRSAALEVERRRKRFPT